MMYPNAYQTLISVRQLQQLIGNGELVILDARFNLADTQAGRRAYEQGHIPGAHYVHLDEQLSSKITSTSGRHPMPDLGALASWFSALGITPHKQVVIYDDMGGAMAARCWWLLRLLGQTKVAVLDGGFPAWLKQGFSIEKQVPELSADWMPGSLNTDDLPLDAIIEAQQVLENIRSRQSLLVDARTPERFRGEQEPIDPVAGHIPGAINRPLQLNLEEGGLFKPAEQLQEEWKQLLGAYRPSRVIHMCGSGVTACHNLLAMEHAGLKGAKVYAGSWSEWIRDASRPVASV